MGDSNTRKNDTLGMPHGTATGRLRKMILFNLLCRSHENVCFRCSKEIKNIEELSIEHKQPWEGISAKLFWDLNNIAFSHIRCNTPHTRGGGGTYLRKIGPEGTAWCSGCQDFLPTSSFWKNPSRWNGLRVFCKVCHEKHKTDR